MNEELNRLHKARWHQEKKKLIVDMAQEEAGERARKRKGIVIPLMKEISKFHQLKITIGGTN